MDRTERFYKIELLIRNRGRIDFETLRAELEVSRATLKRDLDFLRDRLGAPIEYDRDLNGYRFAESWRGPRHELPGLWFDERELYSLLMAHQLLSELDSEGVISRHLQPLLDRIHGLLGGAGGDTASLLRRVKIIAPAKRPVPGPCFELVAQAPSTCRFASHANATASTQSAGTPSSAVSVMRAGARHSPSRASRRRLRAPPPQT